MECADARWAPTVQIHPRCKPPLAIEPTYPGPAGDEDEDARSTDSFVEELLMGLASGVPSRASRVIYVGVVGVT